MTSSIDATRLLLETRHGAASSEELFTLVYEELHRLARGLLSRERKGHTFQPTALVNEAYLRLIRSDDVEWADRNHFMIVAARSMRRILLEYARKRRADKRGGGLERITLSESLEPEVRDRVVDLLDLDEALTELGARSERQAQVVELRFFAGLSVDDIAASLDVSTRTVKNDWRFARAWLFGKLNSGSEP